jgi:hypothetical protein
VAAVSWEPRAGYCDPYAAAASVAAAAVRPGADVKEKQRSPVAEGGWEGFDLEVLDRARFARGKLVESRYGYSVVG